MSIFNPKKGRKPPPPWLKWMMVGFIALAILNGYRAEKGIQEGDAPRIDDYPAFAQFVSVGNWRKQLNPDLGKAIETQEISQGKGVIAVCGQSVTLSAKAIVLGDVAMPEHFQMPKQPMHFTIGDGTASELFDRGVRGMQSGGVRQILAGAWLIDESLPPNQFFPFEFTLNALSPQLTDAATFKAITQQEGIGTPALCGDTIKIALTNEAGETHEAVIELGKSRFGHGIDRAALGIRMGERRSVQLPKPFLNAQGSEFPFKKAENTLVQLTRLPYTEPDSPPTLPEEQPDHESDRQTPERH